MWDEEPDAGDYEENIYIKDPEKGIAFVSQILSSEKKIASRNNIRDLSTLDWLMDERLFYTNGKINIVRELDFYQSVTKISDKLLEQKKIKLLQDKCVIGIGGKVSAGKSKFINSLLDDEILPEDQIPCTAIPTYIVKGNEDDRRAYTLNNRDIVLDKDAVQALAHSFHKKYNIGFSNIITNIVINTKNFAYDNIAILDTPGYNKDDSDIMRNISDAEKAMEELKGVDYLIWLIDAEKGSVTENDLQFIRSLELHNPPLIVYNKADIKPDIEAIVKYTWTQLKSNNLEVQDVIAYSSMEGKEYTDEGKLSGLFEEWNTGKRGSIRQEINTLTKEMIEDMKKLLGEKYNIRDHLGSLIYNTEDPMRITALVKLYAETLREKNDISYFLYNTGKNMEEINKHLDSMGL
jgi:tRNA U34 5-carboxymethylaminomethyl modifying GTPase MnmE/TrmE